MSIINLFSYQKRFFFHFQKVLAINIKIHNKSGQSENGKMKPNNSKKFNSLEMNALEQKINIVLKSSIK